MSKEIIVEVDVREDFDVRVERVAEQTMQAAMPHFRRAMKEREMTKTLDDVKADMSELYEQLKSGGVEIKQAAELANITGKYLKAEQLKLAREIFVENRATRPQIESQP